MYSNLETQFPHAPVKLTLLWGLSECTGCLDELLYDSHRVGRAGFPLSCAEEIMLLHYIHNEVFPVTTDIWTTGSFKHI